MRRVGSRVRVGRLACGLALALPAAGNAFSLFAIGDTGRPPHWVTAASGQYAVAAGLEQEDEHSPVDALRLLGDNFYENGLRQGRLVEQIRGNVVAPYCRFVDLGGPRSSEVADACDRPAESADPRRADREVARGAP